MELYEEFYRRAIINLSMELSVFYVCSNFGHSFGPRTRTGTGPTQKATNWIFLSKAAILKSLLVCHCWIQRAAHLQCSTSSPLKFPKYLDSSETASKKQMWSWCGAWIQALSPPTMWNQEGFGIEQLFWPYDRICSCPSYLLLSQVPLGGTTLSELPTLPQERGRNSPPPLLSDQILVVWEGVWRQQFQPTGLSGIQDAAEAVPGALWHQQTRETWYMSYFSFRMPGLGCSLQKSCHDPCSRFSTAATLTTSFKAQQPRRSHPGTGGNIQESERSFSPLGLRHSNSQPKHQCKDYPGVLCKLFH